MGLQAIRNIVIDYSNVINGSLDLQKLEQYSFKQTQAEYVCSAESTMPMQSMEQQTAVYLNSDIVPAGLVRKKGTGTWVGVSLPAFKTA